MFGKKGKIIATIAAGVGAAVLIGGSATLFSPALSGIIDRALTNDNFDFGEGFQEVAAKSDELCQKIGEEGIVMLKNEYDTLPFKSKKVNVFGWNSTDKGFFLRGIGSGSSSISEDKAVTLLYLDGLSQAEMADILGINEAAVGMRVMRIKKKLQTIKKEDL